MFPRPPHSTRTDPRCPYTTLFRSKAARLASSSAASQSQSASSSFGRSDFQASWRSATALAEALSFRSADCAEKKTCRTDTSRHPVDDRSEEHTSELQSLMRNSYAVFCLKKKQEKTSHRDRHKTKPDNRQHKT